MATVQVSTLSSRFDTAVAKVTNTAVQVEALASKMPSLSAAYERLNTALNGIGSSVAGIVEAKTSVVLQLNALNGVLETLDVYDEEEEVAAV